MRHAVDVGKLVLLAEMPNDYAKLLNTVEETHITLLAAEHERFGCTHANLGAYLMSIWGLPFPLVQAVAFHHHPRESAEAKFSSLTSVHAADAIASAADVSPLNHDGELDLNYLDLLGLREKEGLWRSFYEEQCGPSRTKPNCGIPQKA